MGPASKPCGGLQSNASRECGASCSLRAFAWREMRIAHRNNPSQWDDAGIKKRQAQVGQAPSNAPSVCLSLGLPPLAQRPLFHNDHTNLNYILLLSTASDLGRVHSYCMKSDFFSDKVGMDCDNYQGSEGIESGWDHGYLCGRCESSHSTEDRCGRQEILPTAKCDPEPGVAPSVVRRLVERTL
jgi:hypothetical protein